MAAAAAATTQAASGLAGSISDGVAKNKTAEGQKDKLEHEGKAAEKQAEGSKANNEMSGLGNLRHNTLTGIADMITKPVEAIADYKKANAAKTQAQTAQEAQQDEADRANASASADHEERAAELEKVVAEDKLKRLRRHLDLDGRLNQQRESVGNELRLLAMEIEQRFGGGNVDESIVCVVFVMESAIQKLAWRPVYDEFHKKHSATDSGLEVYIPQHHIFPSLCDAISFVQIFKARVDDEVKNALAGKKHKDGDLRDDGKAEDAPAYKERKDGDPKKSQRHLCGYYNLADAAEPFFRKKKRISFAIHLCDADEPDPHDPQLHSLDAGDLELLQKTWGNGHGLIIHASTLGAIPHHHLLLLDTVPDVVKTEPEADKTQPNTDNDQKSRQQVGNRSLAGCAIGVSFGPEAFDTGFLVPGLGGIDYKHKLIVSLRRQRSKSKARRVIEETVEIKQETPIAVHENNAKAEQTKVEGSGA